MESSLNMIIDKSFIGLAIILAIGIIMGELSSKLKIPDVVLYLISGIVIGPMVLNIINVSDASLINQIVLVFGASFLLYLGGREIDITILNKIKISVISLATLGILISTVIVGFSAHFLFNVDLYPALLIGACVSSTDPASLVPVFQKVKIKNKLKQTVISESAFNDAMGTVAVLTIISIINSGHFSIISSSIDFIKMIGIGTLVGLICGFSVSFIFTEGRFKIYQFYYPILTLITIIITYTISDMFGGSGYMATFILGIICGNKRKFGMSIPEDSYIAQKYFRDTMSVVIIMAIFILLGTHVDFNALFKYWYIALTLTFILMFIARPLSVFTCTNFDKKSNWQLNDKLFISWVRETGVIPAAMSSIIVSMKIPGYELISSVVFTAILITLVVQGTTTAYVAKKLKVLE